MLHSSCCQYLSALVVFKLADPQVDEAKLVFVCSLSTAVTDS